MLELGIGNGDVTRYLFSKGIAMEGVDAYSEAIINCRKTLDIPLYQIHAAEIDFHDAYDVVGAFDLLEHTDNDLLVMKKMFEACKKGGRIIVTVPAHRFLWSYFDILAHHKRRYSQKDLIEKIAQAGFQLERVSFFMTLLLPIVFVYRTIIRLSGRDKNLINQKGRLLPEHVPVPILNTIALFFLKVEKLLLRFIDLPFGTSLILIAKKK